MPPSSRGAEQAQLSQHLRSTMSGKGRLSSGSGEGILPSLLSRTQSASEQEQVRAVHIYCSGLVQE